MTSTTAPVLLEIDHLKVLSATNAELVRDVSLTIHEGEIVGLVGESGCGKSITALTVAGLLPPGIRPGSGRVVFQGRDITCLPPAERRKLNGNSIGMVFQDALSALNPTMRVGRQICEVLRLHSDLNKAGRVKRVIETMLAVGLQQPKEIFRRFPHELSGGQRQRVLIAMALINRPALLIADEPTTALDVAVQAQILELIREINRTAGVSVLFISHDLSTVRRLCDRVEVLYAGIPAETGPTEDILKRPAHVYTRMLLDAIPTPDKKYKRLSAIPGRLPDSRGTATHCMFADRCPAALPICKTALPPVREVRPGHFAACFLNELKEGL